MKDILVFMDDNCRSCEKIVGVMMSLAQEDASMNIRVIHRRKEPAVAVKYNVQIVPAVYMNGVLRFYGEVTREEFQQSLNKFYKQSKKGGIRNEET